jgi:hypothetical protein
VSRTCAQAQQPDSTLTDLAKQAKNPLPDIINVPFQHNLNFGSGPGHDTQYVLNIQPVIPFHLPGDWHLVTRTILAVINQPEIDRGQGSTFGLGDTDLSLFLSPPSSETFIWGFGPIIRFPTASAEVLGGGKWGIGPTIAAVVTPGPWVVGGLLHNIWSFAGDSTRPAVNQMLLQPAVSYNLPDGWFLTTGPEVTADWKAPSRDRWTVPIGGGVGKVVKIAQQSLNLQAEAYYNVERPAGAAVWTLTLTLQFLLSK